MSYQRGGRRGGGRGNYRGGQNDRGHQQASRNETWELPPPRAPPRIAQLAPPADQAVLPAYDMEVIPLQKPKAPGKVNWAIMPCYTNYYELKLGKKYPAVYFYTVAISKRERAQRAADPPRRAARERRLGTKLNRKVFARVPREAVGDQVLAFDGRGRACAVQLIPNDGVNLDIDFDGDIWNVTLTYESVVPLNGVKPGEDYFQGGDEEQSLLSLAIIMNHMPSQQFTPIGRGFYGLPGKEPIPINGGFECWQGYKAHIIPANGKLYVNVNYAVTAFVKPGNLVDLLPELLELRRDQRLPTRFSERNIADLRMKLTRCQAEVTHRNEGRTFTIATITRESASNITFTGRDGRRMSVAQYFENTYTKLDHPEWPCVQVGSVNPRHIPLEKVRILTGNPYRGEQSSDLVTDIIRCAAIPPRQRLAEIRAIADTIGRQSELDREFDIQIGGELQVPSRIIPPPTLFAGKNRQVKVNPGVLEFKGNTFFIGSKIDRWAIIVTDERVARRDVDRFAEIFVRQCNNTGISLAMPQILVLSDRIDKQRLAASIEKTGECFTNTRSI